MKRHYGPSTRRRMGELEGGMRVQTAVLNNDAVLVQVQTEIFNVYGRILVKQLYCEAITIFDNVGTTLLFNATFVPVVAGVLPMTGASAGLALLAQGLKVKYLGGAVATAASINVGEACISPHIIGTATIAGVQGVGTIGQLTGVGDQTSGTCQFVIYYVPMEDGSYVTSIL